MNATTKSARKRRLLVIGAKLPEVVIEEIAGHVSFAVRKKIFAWYLDNHQDDGIVAISFKAPPGINTVLIATDPRLYYMPAYSGPRGWGALRLDVDDGDVDWAQVERHLADAYKLTAPKTLASSLTS